MKKYPVTYKNKEYEVKWDYSSSIMFDYIELYSVTHKTTFFKRDKIIYKETYRELVTHGYSTIDDILKTRGIDENDADYYIQQVKVLFELWEDSIKEKQENERVKNSKLTALAEWDGKIENVKVRK